MGDVYVLKKQLELVRFEKTIEYIHTTARSHKKHLNVPELAQLNNMLTHTNDDPWRVESVSLRLPSGRIEKMSMISNPLFEARDIIFRARDEAEQGNLAEAASYLYSQLVLKHFFKDANRRTAVAAVYWLLLERDVEIPAMGLLQLGLGDLRMEKQLDTLNGLIAHTIALADKE
ncbi:MAG TPA: Fic family protein [Bdellovibrionales bacterium]|nr:Fic family protein [Bdellovibrionales bacterium]